MANLVVLLTQYFARMGLASALVQKPDLSDDEIRASSTAGIAIGLICMAVVWVLAPAVGALFRAPALPPTVRGLSVSFVFMGWSMTGLGLLRRQLRFRALSLVAVGTYVFAYLVVGVGLALLGAGVWSLVAASVTSTALQSILQYALLRHPVRPVLRWEPYRTVCWYGARLSGAYLIDYIGGNLDTFAVTRIASTAVVGQYSRAYYLVFQPLGNYLAQALTNVLFSTLSRIQQDLARLRRAFLSILSIASIVLFPVCAGMAVAAQELVQVLLGPQWTLVPGLVPWFAVAGGCHVASQMSQLLAEARAELKRSLAVQVTYLVALALLLLLAAVPFRGQGVWVIAAAVASAEVLRYLGYLRLARRILRLASGQVWRAHLPAAFAGAGVALAVAAVRAPLTGHAPAILVLGAEMCVGALALALCIRLYPLPVIRRELRLRLDAAGLLGAAGGLRRRLARLVLGPEAPAAAEGNP
jgi:lipopolysaccharide exporter